MLIVSMDPGKRACGVAVWRDAELHAAAWVRTVAREKASGAEAWAQMAFAVERYVQGVFTRIRVPEDHIYFVAEVPQTYQGTGRAARVDLDDLLDLAGVVGAVATALAPLDVIVSYRPREWKGNLPKEVMVERVKAKLSRDELSRVVLPPGRKKGSVGVAAHNVMDGIGIGLKYLEAIGLR